MHITPCVYNVAFLCVRVWHTNVSCGTFQRKNENKNENNGKRARGHHSEFAGMCQGFIPCAFLGTLAKECIRMHMEYTHVPPVAQVARKRAHNNDAEPASEKYSRKSW
jgi:hypothetical protein